MICDGSFVCVGDTIYIEKLYGYIEEWKEGYDFSFILYIIYMNEHLDRVEANIVKYKKMIDTQDNPKQEWCINLKILEKVRDRILDILQNEWK